MSEKKTSAKEEFDTVFQKEQTEFKVTLLEKHLIESRDEFNRLKEEELKLRQAQTDLIEEMRQNLEKTKKVDEILAASIDEKIETIKSEMFDEWQESVKESLVASVAALTEDKLKEYRVLYEEQNKVIENQAKRFKNILLSTRLIRALCYTVCFVATLVLLFIPIANYLVKDIKAFLEVPSVWGGVILFTSVLLMALAIALAVLIRKRGTGE